MPTLAEEITAIGSTLKMADPDGGTARAVSLGVANQLGWSSGSARIRSVAHTDSSFQISRAFVGGQPAAVFVAGTIGQERALIDNAALYAYHASVPWGIVASPRGATVFNSHWIRDDDWFRLPIIPWDDIEHHIHVLEAITPEGLTSGRAERVVTEIYKPDRFLRSVDDALVDRLDHWRDETLRHSRGVTGVDAKLQALFAQLFVLRTVEDRGLAPDLPTLESTVGPNWEADSPKLHELFDVAKTQIGSELFDEEVLDGVPSFILAGIIRDLYLPGQLPREGSRYNFAWIDADVLGLAYEKYLSTVLMPAPVAAQLGLFRQPVREVERVSVRKAGGVYYTPPYITRYLAEKCIDEVWGPDFEPDSIPRIGDFACGSGSFLVAAADVILQRLHERDPNRNWVHELVTGRHLVGVDVDEKAVTMARLNLWTRFTEEPHPLPLPRLAESIVHGDSLGLDVWDRLPEGYDVVLGNPPFLATSQAPNKEELASRFETAQGRFDYSYLFVELATRRLHVGGVLGLVVPNRLYRNRDAGIIRRILTARMDILTIVDFGSNEVFEGTSAYVGTIVARKRAEGDESPAATKLRVITVTDLAPQFIGALLTRAHDLGTALRNDSLSAYDATHPRGSEPWLLLSERAKQSRAQLEEESDPLPTFAGIYQGIRTGANDIFIGTIESGEGESLVRFVNGLGESAIVESALLHRVVFGSDIQRYDIINSHRYLLYPYRSGNAIPETELGQQYPESYAYLNRYRGILAERGSVQSAGLRWYELVRKRDEVWLNRPKLLIRDLATETSFAIDQPGETFLVGGTAVVPIDPDTLLTLLAYLNSRHITNYLTEITPSFRGGFQKFEPQHLQRIPVPHSVIEQGAVSAALEDLAISALAARARRDVTSQRQYEDEINRLLSESLGGFAG